MIQLFNIEALVQRKNFPSITEGHGTKKSVRVAHHARVLALERMQLPASTEALDVA